MRALPDERQKVEQSARRFDDADAAQSVEIAHAKLLLEGHAKREPENVRFQSRDFRDDRSLLTRGKNSRCGRPDDFQPGIVAKRSLDRFGAAGPPRYRLSSM